MALTEARDRQRARPLILVLVVALSIVFALALTEGIFRIFKLWAVPDYLAMDWYRKPANLTTLTPGGVPYLLKPNWRTTCGIGRRAIGSVVLLPAWTITSPSLCVPPH